MEREYGESRDQMENEQAEAPETLQEEADEIASDEHFEERWRRREEDAEHSRGQTFGSDEVTGEES
ncbi:MAG: hypothetical protein ACXWNK_19370 [Vulcanimicrobiaceae bacterium]